MRDHARAVRRRLGLSGGIDACAITHAQRGLKRAFWRQRRVRDHARALKAKKMSQQGILIGDDARIRGQEDAMSMSGESVNQHLERHPSGEGLGGGLLPQESGHPSGSNQWLVVAEGVFPPGQSMDDMVPGNRALVGPMQTGVMREGQGPLNMDPGRGQDPSASMAAAAASTLTQAAINAAHQSALAGHQAQHASQQSEAAGQQAQQAFNVGASALHQTQALRDETSQVLGQVKTGLEALHERQGAALSVAQNSDA